MRNANLIYNTEFLAELKDFKPFSKKVLICLTSSKPGFVNLELLSDHQSRLHEFIANTLSRRRDVFKHIKYAVEGGRHRIDYELADSLKEYHSNPKKRFIKIDLEEYGRLRSRAAMNLYEVLLSFKDTGKLDTSIAFLRKRLGPNYTSSPSYKYTSRFKSVVLLPALAQLETFTKLRINKFQIEKNRVLIHFDYLGVRKPESVDGKEEKITTETPDQAVQEIQTKPEIEEEPKEEEFKFFRRDGFSQAQNELYHLLRWRGISEEMATDAILLLGQGWVKELLDYVRYEAKGIENEGAYMNKCISKALEPWYKAPPEFVEKREEENREFDLPPTMREWILQQNVSEEIRLKLMEKLLTPKS